MAHQTVTCHQSVSAALNDVHKMSQPVISLILRWSIDPPSYPQLSPALLQSVGGHRLHEYYSDQDQISVTVFVNLYLTLVEELVQMSGIAELLSRSSVLWQYHSVQYNYALSCPQEG